MKKRKNYLLDMDGVLVRGSLLVPGADKFIQDLQDQGIPYLLLTNNSTYTARDLAYRLKRIGMDIPPEKIFTSALATSRFLQSQKHGGTVYVIGESGLTQAIHEAGFVMTEFNPDYVVIGEVRSYNMDQITAAIRFIDSGAFFIVTNSDSSGAEDGGPVPGAGALAALIRAASGREPFFIGKPNPLMMRSALNYLGAHSEDSVMVGDRMDTDIVGGVMNGMETILVLSGVTSREEVRRFPYQPTHIYDSVAEIPLEIEDEEPHQVV
jgi:NagD protein